ncbi:MAG: N-acetylmuramoyl-L-alanine amidase [Chloroflexi bacterium]|nr:N-acetylmuramoyl-L-alanine amidase [Chloroflexota bacterium]
MPGILGEPLFVTNDQEARLLKEKAVLEAVAKGYFDGIVSYSADRSFDATLRLMVDPFNRYPE